MNRLVLALCKSTQHRVKAMLMVTVDFVRSFLISMHGNGTWRLFNRDRRAGSSHNHFFCIRVV